MQYDVYWCITRGGWSIRDPQSGLVVAHVPRCVMRNARFVVQQGGRLRVLRERRKNVHAYVRGETIFPAGHILQQGVRGRQIRYDPYTMSEFQFADTGAPCASSTVIEFTPEGRVYELTTH